MAFQAADSLFSLRSQQFHNQYIYIQINHIKNVFANFFYDTLKMKCSDLDTARTRIADSSLRTVRTLQTKESRFTAQHTHCGNYDHKDKPNRGYRSPVMMDNDLVIWVCYRSDGAMEL